MKKTKLTDKRINEIFNGIEEVFSEVPYVQSLYAHKIGDEIHIEIQQCFCKKTKDKKVTKRSANE